MPWSGPTELTRSLRSPPRLTAKRCQITQLPHLFRSEVNPGKSLGISGEVPTAFVNWCCDMYSVTSKVTVGTHIDTLD